MKANNSPALSSLTSRTLKVVGVIFCSSFLLNSIVFFLPESSMPIFSRAWQMTLTSQLVDRGIIPMIGIALLVTSSWVESNYGGPQEKRPLVLDLKFWAMLFASILGLVYLIMLPLQLGNTNQELQDNLNQITQQATQAEAQVNSQLSSPQYREQITQQQNQLKSQLSGILSDDKKYQEALVSPQVPEPFKKLLKDSKANPKAVDQFLAQQAEELPTKLLGEIKTKKDQLEKEARAKSRNVSWQIGTSCLLLAIGYIIIGWTGLKSIVIQPTRWE